MKGSNMKRILVATALILVAVSGCTSAPTTQAPGGKVGSAVTSKPFIGPTVSDPQPLTTREKFILAYRTMKPGDVRTDGELVLLMTEVCGSTDLTTTLTGLARMGYTPDEAGWLVANTPCP